MSGQNDRGAASKRSIERSGRGGGASSSASEITIVVTTPSGRWSPMPCRVEPIVWSPSIEKAISRSFLCSGRQATMC